MQAKCVRTFVAISATIVVLSACGGGVEVPAVTERQENFEMLGGANGAIRDEFEKESPDLAVVEENAATLARLVPEIPTWFPEGSGPESGAETEALPVIWEQPVEFQAAADRAASAVEALTAAVQTGDVEAIRSAAGEVGPACRNCHDNFRLRD